MSLPPKKAAKLKQIIHDPLLKMNIHGRICDIFSETIRSDEQSGLVVSEEGFLQALEQRGIVDDVMKDLQFNNKSLTHTDAVDKPPALFMNGDVAQNQATNINPLRRYLYLHAAGGRAFLEHLHEPEPSPHQACCTFTLHLHFRNQRFKSKPVPCNCEPDLREGFLLEIHADGPGHSSGMADASTMLSISDPVHMVLIKTDTSGDTKLISSCLLDWRTVLSAPNGKTAISVELLGVGSECKLCAGILNLHLELCPPLVESLSHDVIITQKSLERQKMAEKERLFLVYAKKWWQEFLEIRPSNQTKLVKIFAQDENGVNRPVCSYVRALRADRMLESPRHAARFVSLLALEKPPVVGGGVKQEQWCSMMAFLCRNKGDCEDHATLLCSLLLGFGLNAYVCLGTKRRDTVHAWVLTCGIDGSITFWESLTTHRYLLQPIDPDATRVAQQPAYPYRTIGCVFNNKRFLANCQPSDAIDRCVFDFSDSSLWKAMSEEALQSVCAPGSTAFLLQTPPLCPSSVVPREASQQLEMEMRHLLAEHRKDIGLTTVWDDHLSYLLSIALSAYELERSTGVSCGNEEFQDALKWAVPDGHTFKGSPNHFLHHNARKAFTTSLRSALCEDIFSCRGDHVRLALRVCVFVYPESACSVWIMFACTYRSVP